MSVMLKAYFKEHLRNRIRTILYVTLFAFVFVLNMASDNQTVGSVYLLNESSMQYERIRTQYSTLYLSSLVLVICCYIVPIMEFSFFKKRRNLDCAYALPISRKELCIAHYLTGLIMVFIPYTASYLINTLLMLRTPYAYNFAPLLIHYFLCLIYGAVMYTVVTFVFQEGNTVGDGIWFIVLWSFAFLILVGAINRIAEELTGIWFIIPEGYLGMIWEPIDMLTANFQYQVQNIPQNMYRIWYLDRNLCAWLIAWMVIGICAFFGLVSFFGKRRMEKTEEISESWFGFRVLIPFYAIALKIILDLNLLGASWLGVMIFVVLGYTIYRRGFHYKQSDWIMLGILFVVAIL